MSELRDQHKAFAEWFLQQNPVAPNAEDLAWAAWKAAPSAPDDAEPVAWAVMCAGNAVSACLTETAANLIAENLREKNRGRDFDWQATPLYAHPPRDEWREASEPPEESAAHAMGASGSPVVEGERLAFEAWMRGHCWELRATWTGDQYIGTDEGDVKSMATKGMLDADAMRTRMMWAAWRDRGALARMSDIEPPEQEGGR